MIRQMEEDTTHSFLLRLRFLLSGMPSFLP